MQSNLITSDKKEKFFQCSKFFSNLWISQILIFDVDAEQPNYIR